MSEKDNGLTTTAGASVTVSSSQELNEQITSNANALGAGDSLTIQIQGDLTLQEDIAPIDTAGSVTIVAATGTVTVDGGQPSARGFVILSGAVTLSNLTLSNMVSQGSAGGLGAGGGLFIANLPSGTPYNPKGQTPNVTLSNVSFSNCAARGGSVTSNASGGPGGAPGGYGGGGGDGAGTDGQHGTAGNPGMNPTGSNVFGSPISAGFFGAAGPGGQPGGYGGGGSGGGDSGGFDAHDGDPGSRGNPGFQGGHGGYGAGAGAGGGGGGAGGGGGGGDGDFNTGSGASGGLGGLGGSAGSPGFGGGEGAGATPGSQGGGHNGMTGGQGGQGGSGSYAGGGAGFGGAIFVMSGASLAVEGGGAISGGQAVGGTSPGSPSGTGAGPGLFLQGTGTLTFAPTGNSTYTIGDAIADETGAVADGAPPRTGLPTGPDGLPTGGGQGTWGLNMTGDGTLALQGPQAFSGPISVDCGTLDLSSYSNPAANDLTLVPGATLIQRPAAPSSALPLNTLSIISSPNAPAVLALNGNASIVAETVSIPNGVTLQIDPTGFAAGRPMSLIQSKIAMNPPPTVSLSPESGFSAKVTANAIIVTMKAPS
ncbi:hypothetical protein A167_00404 [Alcanivorax sp. S71-1-4]|uniref:hypothetical protein n=1 Tax=Alcanivorax sp. S71-1-4 TaxID=1177159 RepID=UPI001357E6A0|nr:hypothetical protein [Alcanivorax sp. S71-1-4]KAF0810917.1 hypothetical protein A167_00404 [Alcanivorax sp. S71-1-4]